MLFTQNWHLSTHYQFNRECRFDFGLVDTAKSGTVLGGNPVGPMSRKPVFGPGTAPQTSGSPPRLCRTSSLYVWRFWSQLGTALDQILDFALAMSFSFNRKATFQFPAPNFSLTQQDQPRQHPPFRHHTAFGTITMAMTPDGELHSTRALFF